MAKTLVETVVKQLEQERSRLQKEIARVTSALTAFGKVYLQASKPAARAVRKKRTISAAGRKRIAEAQRARWARVKAAAKK